MSMHAHLTGTEEYTCPSSAIVDLTPAAVHKTSAAKVRGIRIDMFDTLLSPPLSNSLIALLMVPNRLVRSP
jgi:hypothetical protein